jgi:hypothetical protein
MSKSFLVLFFKKEHFLLPSFVAAAVLAVVSIFLFCRRALHALWILPFVDETQHLVGAQVLRAGGVLYRDYVDSHGPLAFVLAQASYGLSDMDQPGAARTVVLIAMLITTLSVAGSPCLRGGWERLSALALFVGLCSSLWGVQALCMLTYQPMAGMLLAIGAAQFTLCAWCDGCPYRAGLFGAGAALALVPFDAYSYAPSAALLAASGALGGAGRWGRREWVPLAAGAAGVLLLAGGWMVAHCDLAGYAAYHVIFNQLYYARYVGFGPATFFASFVPDAAPQFIAHTMALSVALLGWLALALQTRGATRGPRRAAMLVCGLAGLALSNPRGSSGFQDGAFVILGFAFAALGWSRLIRGLEWPACGCKRGGATAAFTLAIVVAELSGRAALSSPHGDTRAALVAEQPVRLVRSDGDDMRRLRQAVAPGEPILALPFQPDIYLSAGRLPMTGFAYYFPWDADYARHPWLGRGRDICAALRRAPPPVIYDNDWKVVGRFAPRDYMPCVGDVLARSYWRAPPPNASFYVRNDRVAAWQAQP